MVVKNFPRVGLYFRFYGDLFDPDEITRRLGIQPTTSFRPGDPITEDGRGKRRGYGWMLRVGPKETLDIEDMLEELRARMNVSPTVVRQLCADLNLTAVIVCGVGGGGADTLPATYFPAEFLTWAVDLGAAVNVDVIL